MKNMIVIQTHIYVLYMHTYIHTFIYLYKRNKSMAYNVPSSPPPGRPSKDAPVIHTTVYV